jgi:hypothetical protein
MRNILKTISLAALIMLIGASLDTGKLVFAQTQTTIHGSRFVDENGDGINDPARDDDKDGIPNGMDPDYKGSKFHHVNRMAGFIDENGNGINDNARDFDNDGVPKCQDPDFVRPGNGHGRGNNGRRGYCGRIDENTNSSDKVPPVKK